jgi:hypothetical protein
MSEKKQNVPSQPLKLSLSAQFKQHKERQKQLREENGLFFFFKKI